MDKCNVNKKLQSGTVCASDNVRAQCSIASYLIARYTSALTIIMKARIMDNNACTILAKTKIMFF